MAEQALAAYESVRASVTSPALKASFANSVHSTQELDIDILMRLHAEHPELGYAARAFRASENSRAQSVIDLLRETGTEIRRGVDEDLLVRERHLESLIARRAEEQTRLMRRAHEETESAALVRQLDSLTNELELVRGRIRETSPQYAALRQPTALDLDEIQRQVLDDQTLLLEYSLGEEKSYLWAVTPSTMECFDLPPRKQIEAALRRVRDRTIARNVTVPGESPQAQANRILAADAGYMAAAKAASEMLLGPVAQSLPNKRLLIVGDGALLYLSFAALLDPQSANQPLPLVMNHEIVNTPSASLVSLLRQERNRTPADRTLAILADPVFTANDPRIASPSTRGDSDGSPRTFVRLRFSRQEANAIAAMAPAKGTLKALDFDASRETVLKPGFGSYRIVHFATHSLLNDTHPELSGVVLSLVDRSGKPRNGFLRLYDIYNLRLGSNLVVLSACQTAIGHETTGEGLNGLTRGFFYAGATSVVASLWAVDDRTTAELMTRFYDGILRHNEPASAALRAAQIDLWKLKGWSAPYYWAAFTIQGEWR